MEAEIVTYISKLLHDPTDFVTHIRWCVATSPVTLG